MQPSRFDEVSFFRELHRSGARALLIGRYVLKNDEHIDVLVASALSTIDGRVLQFDALWTRRHAIALGDVDVPLPSIDDLILTKQVASRPKDLEDIRLLRILKEEQS